MERSNTLHPVFQETLRGFVRASRIASKILSEAELIEHYGVSPYPTQERCVSCNQAPQTLADVGMCEADFR